MKGRTLALFLLVYLSLDVANPFMPGAVTFVDGRLEVIDAGRPARTDLPVLNGPSAARPSRGEPALTRPPARLAPTGERPPRWRIPARRGLALAPEPALSSDDH